MAEVQTELRRVLGPHLTSMRKDLQSAWPTLDPELTLLHWLCERNGVNPPAVSLQRKDEEAGPKASSSVALVSPSKNDKGYTEQRPPATSNFSAASTVAPSSITSYTRPYTELASSRLPPLSARGMNSSGSALRSAGGITAGMSSQALECVPSQNGFGLRSLDRVDARVNCDAVNYGSKMGLIQQSRDKVSSVIANIRHDLRGKFIGKVPLLSREVLTEEEQFALVGFLTPHNVRAGHEVVTEGDAGDTLFIIEQGTCAIYRKHDGKQNFVCEIGREDFFGELSVICGTARGATVIAQTSATLLSLSRADLFSTISEEKMKKLITVATSRFFGSIPALSALSSSQKIHITEHLRSDTYEAGAVLTRQNAIVTGAKRRLFVIQTGELLQERKFKKTPQDQGWSTESKKLQIGSFFGMKSMWYGCPLVWTTSAEGPVTVLSVSYQELLDICSEGDAGTEMIKSIRNSMKRYLLKEVDALKSLPDDKVDGVMSQMQECTFKRWDQLYTKGNTLDTLFILQEGRVSESSKNLAADQSQAADEDSGTSGNAEPGTAYGTQCLERGPGAADATLVALTDCSVLSIPGVVLRSALAGLNRKTTYKKDMMAPK